MRRALRFLGICLILVGLGLGGTRIHQHWQSDREYRSTQQALQKELRTSSAPRAGDALARLRIPRFGSGYTPVIVEGVSQEALKKGPGHYPGTAMPGELGNFAVAGHRTGWGQPFHRLPELKKGDAIEVEWQGRSYTYRVTRTKLVVPSDVGVVLPVPGRRGAEPDTARITLTTCADRGRDGTYVHRLVVQGELGGR
ncbi:class E sortase [Streptomyces sp. HUCO-GS316]|uniref:class E sortase n=1 Tax=Streptomyces sp. HUCO-GS316 TaxID=2692198 RepID=UPI00136F98B1|nr:class E sortase [Streptomyces sp. HUCO-GS316]MXM62082.1 class E sortase [Streptomyces sp. HUCO-GS316]